MWLTTELLEKDKRIEMMKNNIDKKNEELFIIKKKKLLMLMLVDTRLQIKTRINSRKNNVKK